MSNRHFFICPHCGEPTREIFDIYCLDCSKVIAESEEVEAHVRLVHRASQSAVSVIGHPGTA